MVEIIEYPITPVAKPRMTRADRWKHRPIVDRYMTFKDLVRYHRVEYCIGDGVVFGIPVPKSWSKAKKKVHINQPHEHTPDIDNLLKALFDALYENDAHIWKVGRLEKRWADEGYIKVVKN